MVRAKKRASQVARESERFQTAVRQLGLKVRRLRQEQELTLEIAAERMDVDWKYLQKVEAGLVNITLVTLVRVTKGLRMSLEDLFVGME